MKVKTCLPLLLGVLTTIFKFAATLELVYLVGKKGVQVIDFDQLKQHLHSKEFSSKKSSSLHRSSPDVCVTKGCVRIAAVIIDNIDETIDPCQDFYSFACGGYIKRTLIPDNRASMTTWSEISENVDYRMRLILERGSSSNDTLMNIMTRRLYKSCINDTQINELGVEPLLNILKEYGGWPVVEANNWNEANFSFLEVLNTSNKLGFSTDILFSFGVEIDDKNSSRRVIVLDSADLGLDMEHLIKGVDDPVVKAYLKHSTNVAEFLGATAEAAEKEMLEMLLFEIELANISTSKEERRNYTELYNALSIKDLQAMTASVPWLGFMNDLLPLKAQIKMDEKIVVYDLNFFRKFDDLMSKVSNRTLANYMIWRMIKEAVPYLTDEISSLDSDLKIEQEGKSEDSPGWKICVDLVEERLPYAMGNIYIKNYFNEEAKVATKSMVEYLRSSFEGILKSVDWMDETTKSKALEKLKAIRAYIAYPDELLLDRTLEEYYKNLSVDEHSLLGNILRINVFYNNEYYGKLHEKVDKNAWKEYATVTDVNAYYYSNDNSIRFPAGVLQGILFDPGYPQYVNYAGIGWVIGHEITHAFDDSGKQYDANGELNNWWEPETEQKFNNKAKCIIDQYSNYTVPEIGVNLDGNNTEGENIADNGGTKESYMAYQRWVMENGPELGLPGLNYNTNQLYWIAHAQQECGVFRKNYLRQMVLTDEHSPERFRIIGSYSNSQEFANDFMCPVGTGMNPVQKCAVW